MSTRNSSKSGSENATGKSGNASGSQQKESRGPSYEPPPSDQEHRGKHPPNKQNTGPKDMHPHKQPGSRQSDKG